MEPRCCRITHHPHFKRHPHYPDSQLLMSATILILSDIRKKALDLQSARPGACRGAQCGDGSLTSQQTFQFVAGLGGHMAVRRSPTPTKKGFSQHQREAPKPSKNWIPCQFFPSGQSRYCSRKIPSRTTCHTAAVSRLVLIGCLMTKMTIVRIVPIGQKMKCVSALTAVAPLEV